MTMRDIAGGVEGVHDLGIAEGSMLLAAGELSPVEWVSALLDRIRRFDATVNAFLHVAGEQALASARAAEVELGAGRRRGPLHGVPFALKDMIDTADMPTTAQSRQLAGRMAPRDAAAVTALKRAGAIAVGKLATHEFAHGGPSLDVLGLPARNPWNPAHFPGSSSSGSAAAVAAGFVPFTLGTDTGGSIRIPAGMCGIAGHKPTFGLVSKRGVIPLCHSLDVCGPMAWTPEDCALVMDVIEGFDPSDPSSSAHAALPGRIGRDAGDLKGIRIGVVRHFWEEDLACNQDAVAAMEDALLLLQGLGAELRDLRLSPLRLYNDVRVIVQEPEAFAIHQRRMIEAIDGYGEDFLTRILPACGIGAVAHVQAGRERTRLVREMAQALCEVDLLVTIGAGPAPAYDTPGAFGGGEGLWGEKPNLTSPFSLTGFPALSVATGFAGNGLPVSMQIVGAPFDDRTVLAAGMVFWKERGLGRRRPRLPAEAAPQPFSPDRFRTPPRREEEPADAGIGLAAIQAGLRLDASHAALLHARADSMRRMVDRIPIAGDWAEEPATTFVLDGVSARIADARKTRREAGRTRPSADR